MGTSLRKPCEESPSVKKPREEDSLRSRAALEPLGCPLFRSRRCRSTTPTERRVSGGTLGDSGGGSRSHMVTWLFSSIPSVLSRPLFIFFSYFLFISYFLFLFVFKGVCGRRFPWPS